MEMENNQEGIQLKGYRLLQKGKDGHILEHKLEFDVLHL